MKMKKLTALMSAVMLAVCAVPMGAGAENLMGDLNSNGVIDEEDGNLLVKYVLWDTYDDRYSEEYHNFYKTYGDMNGDGIVDYDDIEFFSETYAGDITLNNKMGDINHDGYVDAVDATSILIFYADISTGQEDKYPEERLENIFAYGDMNGDGAVNAVDATEILMIYAENSTTSIFPTNE